MIIRNRADTASTLLITSTTLRGVNANQYTIVQMPASSLDSGLTTRVILSFTPTLTGLFRDTLRIVSNAAR